MCGVELVEDKAAKQPFPAGRKVGPQVLLRAREHGMLSRVKGDSYLLAPPIVITHAQLDRCVEILSRSINETLAAGGG